MFASVENALASVDKAFGSVDNALASVDNAWLFKRAFTNHIPKQSASVFFYRNR